MTPNKPTLRQIKDAFSRNETGDSELVAFMFKGQIVFDADEKLWYTFNGEFWEFDKVGQVSNLIANQVADCYSELSNHYWKQHAQKDDGNDARAKQYQQRCFYLMGQTRINRVIERAKSHPDLVITSDVWELDPMELPAQNGIIDLKSGKLRQSKPEDFIRHPMPTKYNPKAKAPIFEKFILEICNGDIEKVKFLQRLYGYGCTGSNREHVMPIFTGIGRNGKDTLVAAIQSPLGDIMGPVGQEVMLDGGKNPNAASPYIHALRFLRLAYVSETQDESRLHSGQVKYITGAGKLTGRLLNANPITFDPQHLLILMTNFKPIVDADDFAIWERLLLINFDLSFVDNPDPQKPNQRKVDKNLPDKLKQEDSGILNWIINGCLSWQKVGLNPPKSIKAATSQYRTDEDKLAQFVKDEMTIDATAEIKASVLYHFYSQWAILNGYRPTGSKKFYQKMATRYTKEERGDGNYYLGIGSNIFVPTP